MLASSAVISGEPGSIVRLLEGVVIGVWWYRIQMAPVDNWTIGHPGHWERNNSRKILMDKGPFVPIYFRLIILLNFVWIYLVEPRGKNARHLGWGPLGGRDSPATNQKSAPRSRDHHRPIRCRRVGADGRRLHLPPRPFVSFPNVLNNRTCHHRGYFYFVFEEISYF